MVKKAKILKPIGKDFEDVFETLIENDKKNIKQDKKIKKEKEDNKKEK